jgi:hypothetical protein
VQGELDKPVDHERRNTMATWTPDPTFYPSARMAMQAPAERLG